MQGRHVTEMQGRHVTEMQGRHVTEMQGRHVTEMQGRHVTEMQGRHTSQLSPQPLQVFHGHHLTHNISSSPISQLLLFPRFFGGLVGYRNAGTAYISRWTPAGIGMTLGVNTMSRGFVLPGKKLAHIHHHA
jgi:hypothetical protein